MARLDLVVDAVVKGKSNLSGLATDLDTADKKASSLKTTLTKGLAFGGGFVAALGLKEGIEFLGDAVTKAGEFQDTVSATGVILDKDALPALEEFADSAATGFGASKQVALEAVNTFATFGKSAGLAGQDLQSFSTDLTQLAGDLASFRGGTTEDAITAIGAALRGESEPIRRYGVLLDDATLKQKALELGIISTTKQALTPQQRVLAANASIFEQTTDAQGDFLRTQDGFKNSTQALQAEFENITIELGEKLLPALTAVARFIRDTLVPTFDFLGDAASFVGSIVNPFGGVVDRITSDAEKLKESQQKNLKASSDAWESYTQTILDASDQVGDAAAEIAEIPQKEIEAHWDDVRAAAFETVIQNKLGILDGQNEIKVAFEVLTRLQEEEQTKAQRISYLQGKLSSQKLANGLNDEREGVRTAAEAIQAEIIAELASLGVDAYNSGASVPSNLAAGMRDHINLLDEPSSALAAKIHGYLPSSDAKVGPLSDLSKVGPTIVTMIADGIRGSLRQAGRASDALASSLAISPLSTLGAVSQGGSEGPGGVTVNLNVKGDLTASEATLPGTIIRGLFAAGLTG